MVLWQKHVPQTQCLCLLLQILHDGRVRTESCLSALADLVGKDGICWDTFFLDKLLDLCNVMMSMKYWHKRW